MQVIVVIVGHEEALVFASDRVDACLSEAQLLWRTFFAIEDELPLLLQDASPETFNSKLDVVGYTFRLEAVRWCGATGKLAQPRHLCFVC